MSTKKHSVHLVNGVWIVLDEDDNLVMMTGNLRKKRFQKIIRKAIRDGRKRG